MTPVPNPTDGHSNSFYSISIASLTFVIIIFIIIFFILWYTCRQKKEIRDQGRNILKSQHEIIEEQQKMLTEIRTQTEWREIRNNSADITLDANTAHPNLSIAGDKKSLKHEAQPQQVQPNEERQEKAPRADITLDANTAHPNLSIAGDKKSLKHEAQPQQVQPNEERFDSTVCVLGSEGFSNGKHYWEVDVRSSTDWDLGEGMRQREEFLVCNSKEAEN
nr:E3 ubiquitin-protein ligase TRIM69-like [Pelodiscus sinensis]|eukprot:XP_025036080.1 E3 ubiquitin-protein ligase TRIM69-like [Pelodiscus sinensis]